MNYVGLKMEIRKMLVDKKNLVAIKELVDSKWENHSFGFSIRVENLQRLINEVNYIIKKNPKKVALQKITELVKTDDKNF